MVRGTDGERSVWVLAYIAAAQGSFQESLSLARPLATRASDPRVKVACCLTSASVLRQTGQHLEARPYDRRALRLASTRAEGAHALIGLAADAVGLHDARRCSAHLIDAAAAAPRHDWRVWVRLGWVRCEHALMTGRAREAAAHAKRSLERAEGVGARRHVAKSHLFLGVALGEAGLPGARSHLMSAERTATRIGAEPIAAVARQVLGRA